MLGLPRDTGRGRLRALRPIDRRSICLVYLAHESRSARFARAEEDIRIMATRCGLPRYGLPLYPTIEDAAAAGFERVEDNYADGVLLRKQAAKGWEYAVVLHPHLQGAYTDP
jgi:hypothetical protein